LAARPKTLDRAWHAVRSRSSEHSRGYDNVELADFGRSWGREKVAIRQQILANSYKFSPYVGHAIAKKEKADPFDLKSWRPISIASIRDRVVQRAILDRIWPDIRSRVYTPTSFGGIRPFSQTVSRRQARPEEDPRRCVRTAVERIIGLRSQGYSWVFETDIESFFPSIDRKRLSGQLRDLLRDDSIDHMIAAALDTSVANAKELGPLAELWNSEIGVPQGGILSPMLANLYLYELDRQMSQSGYELVRYVDDLIVLARSEAEARAAYELCRATLNNLDLRIHPLGFESNNRVKTNIRAPNQPFEFLGLAFAQRSIRPTEKKFHSLKQKVQDITECKYSRRKLVEVIQHLNWCVTGWVKAYDFCNLSKRDLELIDSLVGDLVRRWLEYRGVIAKRTKLDKKAYSWLGIQLAQGIAVDPIMERQFQKSK
jgi:retron-type reverse transcriptase